MRIPLEDYEIQSVEWHRVRGYVNEKGWLEWKDRDGAQGLKRPGTFRKVSKKEKRP